MRGKMLAYSFKEVVSELSGTNRDEWLLDFISQIEHVTSTRPQRQYHFAEPHVSVMDHMMMPMADNLEHECDTFRNPVLNPALKPSTPSVQSGSLQSPCLKSFASTTSSANDSLVDIVKAATQVLQRSLSSNDSADTSNSPGNSELDEVPQRSYSAPFGHVKIRTQIVTSKNSAPALNGVSQYYSSKTTRVIFDPDNEGLIQLTNSQKIRRAASYSSHNTATGHGSVHPCHSGRLSRVQSLYKSFREVPFPELVRPSSLKDPISSGVNIAHRMRSCQRKVRKSRHRFRHGRVYSSGRGSLMRRAYPNMQCDRCGAVFEGSDRRLQLARHRRKVHAKHQPLAIIPYHEPVHSDVEDKTE
ncbi:hypothetical protein FB567DRAFT_521057 [Paraphoma chrysanthemicola]|uniref:Uncharacterized protein n=1 Tax=Paraphoma chrysanthemicola TaxID=798071 RepID=A0A8K0RAA9_9PLEO|nr:hypothetical protein FB567DRAFT_521057 [Paraphoma chrysanthemicola]